MRDARQITLPRAGKCSDETTARYSIGLVSGEASKQLPICRGTGSSKSISLQQTVRLSPAAIFERQEPGLSPQVSGIDAIYVGPADLAFSLGKTPKLDSEDAEQLGMYEVVLAACRKRGIYPGIHCAEPAYAACMIRMGFRLTTIANDSGLMAKAAREAVAGVWREVGEFR